MTMEREREITLLSWTLILTASHIQQLLGSLQGRKYVTVYLA